ncbi:diaminohydroxyphosphoribosylaminopyrimidine deaminase [Lachnospiraceae bacterium XBB1006]|nr:diaminohydroxyphosphoribosylaminopyrimidine deaminase [Lachnospiraceae bacterium XBB1006]
MRAEAYMRRAIALAEKGIGHTNPNPLVGAVIVKNRQIIGEGYHEKYGALHAERNALKNCVENPEGATMYVTLEPCCHQGKQPPCTEAIIAAGIQRVVIGSPDPNPVVAGKGVARLKDAGIAVEEDFLKDECDKLNDIFFHYIQEKEPFVALKYAMTVDGKIQASNGASQWITGERARRHVHWLRQRYAAILVGRATVEKDDPMLTTRGIQNPSHPLRIVLDTGGRIGVERKIVQTAKDYPTWIATCDMTMEKEKQLIECGVRVVRLPKKNNKVDVRVLLKQLYEEGVDSLLVEGGAEVNGTFLEEGLVNKVYAYIGGRMLGGSGKSPIGGEGLCLCEAKELVVEKIENWETDILVQYHVKEGDACLQES